jgi:hypothetical protein
MDLDDKVSLLVSNVALKTGGAGAVNLDGFIKAALEAGLAAAGLLAAVAAPPGEFLGAGFGAGFGGVWAQCVGRREHERDGGDQYRTYGHGRLSPDLSI